MNPELLLTSNWLASQQQQKNPFWGVGGRWPRAQGCCLCVFALVPIFFGASVSKQNSLADLFYGAVGVPCLQKQTPSCHRILSSGGNRHTFGFAPACITVLWYHEWSYQCPSVAGHSGAVLSGGDSGCSGHGRSPPPVALSCGPCQNSFILLSSSEKRCLLSLARWVGYKMLSFPKHTPHPPEHPTRTQVFYKICVGYEDAVCFSGSEELECPQTKYTHIWPHCLPKLAIGYPSPINQGPISSNWNDFTVAVLVLGARGPSQWLESMHQKRQTRTDLLSHAAWSPHPWDIPSGVSFWGPDSPAFE